jgi:hypothetical protein
LLCGVDASFAENAGQWMRGFGMVMEMEAVSADPHACALAIAPPQFWYLSGGFTHLRRGIALLGLEVPANPGVLSGFDYAIAFDTLDLSTHGMTRLECLPERAWEGSSQNVCLWHNPAGCAGPRPPTLTAPDPPFYTSK